MNLYHPVIDDTQQAGGGDARDPGGINDSVVDQLARCRKGTAAGEIPDSSGLVMEGRIPRTDDVSGNRPIIVDENRASGLCIDGRGGSRHVRIIGDTYVSAIKGKRTDAITTGRDGRAGLRYDGYRADAIIYASYPIGPCGGRNRRVIVDPNAALHVWIGEIR